jgi:hypothetical protein
MKHGKKIAALAITGILAFGLAGCSNYVADDDSSNMDVYSQNVKLPDGSKVTCVISYAGSGSSSAVSCDWEYRATME